MFFGRGYNGMNTCFDRFGFMSGGGWMILIVLALIAIAITVIVLATRSRRRQFENKALDELKILFARGDISEEEYLKRKRLIE